MGDLKIGGATQGFDVNGVKQYIEAIRLAVVEDAITKLRDGRDALFTTIDTVWKGKSADTYKENIGYDVAVIMGALRDAVTVLESSINHSINNMVNMDETLVQKRGDFSL